MARPTRMSIRNVVAAAYLEDLEPSAKLVLMALADSADDDGAGSIPGVAKLRAWSGLGRSRVAEVLAELIAAGWVERTRPGRRGQRAEFRVFPRGAPSIPTAAEVEARLESAPPDPSTGNAQVGTTGDVVHSPADSGSGTADANDRVRVRPDPLQGPAGRTPSLPTFTKDRATPPLRTAPVVDNRRPGAFGASAPAASNNGPAERPVAEVLGESRRTKPAATYAAPPTVRDAIAKARAARKTPTTTEEPPP